MTDKIYKYPRTEHIEGSRFQPGDEDLANHPFSSIVGCSLVIEEKLDGANSAISFSQDGQLLLQSRGHFLLGGTSEKHFNLFKQWANIHATAFKAVLGTRYILYGEWLYAKHTIFYDKLPHYFLEFDLLDKEKMEFLSTERRQEIVSSLPVTSVPILHQGTISTQKELSRLVQNSKFIKSGHFERLRQACIERNLDVERAFGETDPSSLMEGLYIKIEEDGLVKQRFKYVRASFLTAVDNSNSHWLSRPIIPNLLDPNVDIFKT
ncbi:MAG: RNA ligase family protein [Blastocatellia bacterium]|nr:RNA ligase family protein [Blastocatellia bacterium]